MQAMWTVQDVADSLLRSCGRFAEDHSIYFWLEALDKLSYVARSAVGHAQAALDAAFYGNNEEDQDQQA